MKIGARNYNLNRARNTGLARRSGSIIKSELKKAQQVVDKSFSVYSEDMYLHRYVETGRKCSCLNYTSPEQEIIEEDSIVESPVIILDEDMGEVGLDAAIEMLESPREVCPVCYGTGKVGNYARLNCLEYMLDITYTDYTLFNTNIREGKPFYFEPTTDDAHVTFNIQVPGLFEAIEVKKLPIDFNYQDSNAFVDQYSIHTLNLETMPGLLAIRFNVDMPVSAFFIRFQMGNPIVKANIPEVNLAIEAGEYDYMATTSAILDHKYPISTRDLLLSKDSNILWRVTSVQNTKPMQIDQGKEIEIRRVRAFEAFFLIP